MPQVTNTRIKKTAEIDGDGDNNKLDNKCTDNFYPLVHVRIRL